MLFIKQVRSLALRKGLILRLCVAVALYIAAEVTVAVVRPRPGLELTFGFYVRRSLFRSGLVSGPSGANSQVEMAKANARWIVTLEGYGNSTETSGPTGRLSVMQVLVVNEEELNLHCYWAGEGSNLDNHQRARMPPAFDGENRRSWVRELTVGFGDEEGMTKRSMRFQCEQVRTGNRVCIIKCGFSKKALDRWQEIGTRQAASLQLAFWDGAGLPKSVHLKGILKPREPGVRASLCLGSPITGDSLKPRHLAEWLVYHHSIGIHHAIVFAEPPYQAGMENLFDRIHEQYPGFLTVIPWRPWTGVGGNLLRETLTNPEFDPDQDPLLLYGMYERYTDDWFIQVDMDEYIDVPDKFLSSSSVSSKDDPSPSPIADALDASLSRANTAGIEMSCLLLSWPSDWNNREFVSDTGSFYQHCYRKPAVRPSLTRRVGTHWIYPRGNNVVDWTDEGVNDLHIHHIRTDAFWFKPQESNPLGACNRILRHARSNGVYERVAELMGLEYDFSG